MTDIKDVVRDAALKNRVGLKDDDPVMVLVTIMNRIALDWQDCLNAALEGYKNEHEMLAARWRKDATKRAEIVLNAALAAGREAMAKGMSEGAEKVMLLLQKEAREDIRLALMEQKAELRKATGDFKRYVTYILIGCAAAVSSVVVVAMLS